MTADRTPAMPHPHLHDQACRYADGVATPEDVARLAATLETDPAARREFLEILNLAAALDDHASSIEGHPPRSLNRQSRRLPPAAAAILLAVGVGGLLIGRWDRQKASPPAVAAVVREIGSDGAIGDGSVSVTRPYELAVGTLELVTVTGVRIVIEAPAAFTFESAQRLQLRRGRIAADVPPAGKGFTVVTPSGKAIDLGTSFGVSVGAAGETEVHVFQGEVITESEQGRRRSVRGNEAVSLSAEKAKHDVRSAAFIRQAEMPALEAGFAAGQMMRSREMLHALQRDPAVIAVYDFDEPDLPSGPFAVVQGRWPGSKAADFANSGDFLPVNIGDGKRWPHLTLAAWVRLDRVRNSYQSIFHTDLWLEGTGHVHWIVSPLRTIRLAIKGSVISSEAPKPPNDSDSAATVDRDLERWLHVASVYDSDRRTVRFFFNGRFDHESRLSVAPPATLGRGRFGNWTGQERRLSGRIDEFVALGRAMSDEEITALHDAGTPYR
ncbi:MAG: hypothetical protein RLZZ21_2188 [Planctomycetota bacterium]